MNCACCDTNGPIIGNKLLPLDPEDADQKVRDGMFSDRVEGLAVPEIGGMHAEECVVSSGEWLRP